MKKLSLNLDSRYNIFCGRWSSYIGLVQLAQEVPSIAQSTYHLSFDKNEWLLMPEESIIQKFVESLKPITHSSRLFVDRESFPVFPVSHITVLT
jgi:hypothetical protein